MRGAKWASIVVAVLAATSAFAAEKITYTYDALGRLQKAAHSGQVNNGLTLTYQLDPAGNRKNASVTGSSNIGVRQGSVIIVPLNGLTVIPIGN